MYIPGFDAGAFDLDLRAAEMPQPAVGHLGPGAVAGADYEDAERCRVLHRALFLRARAALELQAAARAGGQRRVASTGNLLHETGA